MRWALPLLIIIVFVAALVVSFLPNPKATAEGCPGFCPNLGLDLVGGLRGEYQIISTDTQPVTPEILNQTRAIIEARVNSTGVSEPNVQTQGGNRITVELPGAADADEIRQPRGHHGPARLRGRPQPVRQLHRHRPAAARGHGPDAIFSGDQISAARPGTDPSGLPAVDIDLKEKGAAIFDDYAKAHYQAALRDRARRQGHRGADHQRHHFNGHSQISGSFTTDAITTS